MLWFEMSYNKFISREQEPETWELDENKETDMILYWAYEDMENLTYGIE